MKPPYGKESIYSSAPENLTQLIGQIPWRNFYSLLLLWNHEHGTTRTNLKDRSIAAQVRRELLGSTDVSLVGKVARDLLEEATRISMVSSDNWDLLALKLAATELVTHVSSLEPDNRAWADLMEGAKPCQLQQSSI